MKPSGSKVLSRFFLFFLFSLMCIPPPQPERLVLSVVDNNLLTVEPRAVDPHCFDADADADTDPDPDPVQNLDADPDPDPDPDRGGGGGGVSQKCASPLQNPRYAPAGHYILCRLCGRKQITSLLLLTSLLM